MPTPVAPRRRKHHVSADDLPALVRTYDSGTSSNELSTRIGLANGTTLKLLRQGGAAMRNQRLCSDEGTDVYRIVGRAGVDAHRRAGDNRRRFLYRLRRNDHARGTIGKGVVVGANSCVTKDCEPDTVYVGNPARPLRPIGD